MATDITLRAGAATPADIVLYPLPAITVTFTPIFLYAGQASPNDIRLTDPRYVVPVGDFPTQYFGLKVYFQGAVRDLCLVATADAPAGMGAVPRIYKGGTPYAIYLVETGDTNASPVRLRTSAGTKAIRKKT